jgi:hypothetical protein
MWPFMVGCPYSVLGNLQRSSGVYLASRSGKGAVGKRQFSCHGIAPTRGAPRCTRSASSGWHGRAHRHGFKTKTNHLLVFDFWSHGWSYANLVRGSRMERLRQSWRNYYPDYESTVHKPTLVIRK